MKLIARIRPFLVLGVFTLGVIIVGAVWRTPFHDDSVGAPRVFYSVWDIVTLPYRFLLMYLGLKGFGPTLLGTLLLIAVYLSIFVLLDRLLTRLIRVPAKDAA